MVRLSSPVIISLATVCGSSFALNPITIKGTKFFDSVTKDQFFIKGVAYQPRTISTIDPLATPEDCRRDFALMKDLGLNTVRVYQVRSEGFGEYLNEKIERQLILFTSNQTRWTPISIMMDV